MEATQNNEIKVKKKKKFEDNEKEEKTMKAIVNIKRFLLFHKKRIAILKKLSKNVNDDRLIYQVSILGLESLARVLYPNEKKVNGFRDTKSGFIKILSKVMKRKEAIRFYDFCRNQIIHEGFLTPFSILELWGDGNIGFLETYSKYVDIDAYGFLDYPPETLLGIYEELIYYVESIFKKKGVKSRVLLVKIYNIPKEKIKIEKMVEKRRKQRLKKKLLQTK